MGDELGAVVEPHERRCTAAENGEPVQDGDDAVGVDRSVDLDRESFAGELVDHVQHLQGAAVGGDVELEVQRPQRVRHDRAHRSDVSADAGEALLALLLWDAEALVTPQAPDPLVVDPPAGAAGRLRRRRQPHRGRAWRSRAGTRAAVVPRRRSAAGRAAGWSGADRPACTLVVPRPRTARAASSLLRACGSGSEVSLRELLEHRLVELGLGQQLLQRAFSASSSLSRLASEAFMPPY